VNSSIIEEHVDTAVRSLGKPGIESPVHGTAIFVDDSERVVIDTSLSFYNRCAKGETVPLSFELAGPRRKIFFDPSKTKCGIVTCGGLCPGINAVIRGIVLELHYAYHVENIYGIPFGLQGSSRRTGIPSWSSPPLRWSRSMNSAGPCSGPPGAHRTSERWWTPSNGST